MRKLKFLEVFWKMEVHQSSCRYTPQQNGVGRVAENKNMHLLEATRSLIFSTKIPKYLWGESINTAIYLLDKMPTEVLKFQIPVFKSCFPNSKLISDLPLKIFCCVAFVHIHNHNRGKLDPKAKKCIFVGYSPTQIGHKCFDPISKKYFVTTKVTFFENKSLFDSHLQGEIRNNEDSNEWSNDFVDVLDLIPIKQLDSYEGLGNVQENRIKTCSVYDHSWPDSGSQLEKSSGHQDRIRAAPRSQLEDLDSLQTGVAPDKATNLP